MEPVTLFLSKSFVISALLTSWYLVGLRGRRLHQYNRFFLLSILFFSLTIPFLHFRLFDIPALVQGSLAPVALFGHPVGDLNTDVSAIPGLSYPHPDWPIITGLIAAGISLTFLVILSVRILKLRKICRNHPVMNFEGVKLILTDSPSAPFTFLKTVFWSKSLSLQDEIGQLIFKHEQTHIQQRHTYDKLVTQVLTCVCWFNPFYWLIQKEVNIVHEFIADEQAVNNRDSRTFAMMLLRSYNNGSYLVPEHHFFSSSVKRRLAMLQNAGKSSYGLLRCFMALPVTICAVLLFSFGTPQTASGELARANKRIVLLLDLAHTGKDAGERSGAYAEKETCLKYARHMEELSPAYHVDVQIAGDQDRYLSQAERVLLSDKISPDVFLSLHVSNEPGKEKADFDIYIPGKEAFAAQSNKYSHSIFQAMTKDGIIPEVSGSPYHVHSPGCNCNSCLSRVAIGNPENNNFLSSERESVYVLNHVQAPGMVMVLGNIKNEEEMRQLNDDNRLDVLSNAILKGIVEGATVKEDLAGNLLNLLPGNPGIAKCK